TSLKVPAGRHGNPAWAAMKHQQHRILWIVSADAHPLVNATDLHFLKTIYAAWHANLAHSRNDRCRLSSIKFWCFVLRGRTGCAETEQNGEKKIQHGKWDERCDDARSIAVVKCSGGCPLAQLLACALKEQSNR